MRDIDCDRLIAFVWNMAVLGCIDQFFMFSFMSGEKCPINVLQARYHTVEEQVSQEVPYALHCGDTIHISRF